MKKLISALGALAVMTSVLSTGITDVPENETYVTVNAAVTSAEVTDPDLTADAIKKMDNLQWICTVLSGFLKFDETDSFTGHKAYDKINKD